MNTYTVGPTQFVFCKFDCKYLIGKKKKSLINFSFFLKNDNKTIYILSENIVCTAKSQSGMPT